MKKLICKCGHSWNYYGTAERATCRCGSKVRVKPAKKAFNPAQVTGKSAVRKNVEPDFDLNDPDPFSGIEPIVKYTPAQLEELRRQADEEESKPKPALAQQAPVPQPVQFIVQQPPKTRQQLFVEELERRARVVELSKKLYPVNEGSDELWGLDLEKLMQIKSINPKLASFMAAEKLRNSEEFQEDMAQADRTIRKQRAEMENKELNNSFADAIYHYSRLGKRDFVKKQTGMTDAQIDKIIAEVNAGKVGNKFSNVDKVMKKQRKLEKMEDPARYLLSEED